MNTYLVLPKPMSLNNAYANVPGRGRVPTKALTAWKAEAAQLLACQRPLPRYDQPVWIRIWAGEVGVNAQQDTDNMAKLIIDAIKREGIIKDDNRKRVPKVTLEWVEGMFRSIVLIRPAPEKTPLSALTAKINPRFHELIK